MTPISPIIQRKVEAADRIYFNAVDLFHTTGHYAERRELPEDADKAKELVKKIANDVRVLYGPEDPTEIEEAPCEEKKSKERETITPHEIALLIEDRATRLEANADTWPNDAKKYAKRIRELLDLYDEAFAREEAEFEAQKRPEDFPRTASEVQAMNS